MVNHYFEKASAEFLSKDIGGTLSGKLNGENPSHLGASGARVKGQVTGV
jgi:hypothetical protein